MNTEKLVPLLLTTSCTACQNKRRDVKTNVEGVAAATPVFERLTIGCHTSFKRFIIDCKTPFYDLLHQFLNAIGGPIE